MDYTDLGGLSEHFPAALAKLEVGALLTRGAAHAGVTCIAEFGVGRFRAGAKDRTVDYVWVVRATAKHGLTADPHSGNWILLAAFEIEGYNAGTGTPQGDGTLPTPWKDTESLSSAALNLSSPLASLGNPVLATILFTVHPSGTRPWGKTHKWPNLESASAGQRVKFAACSRLALQDYGSTASISTLLDREVTASTAGKIAPLEQWVLGCRERADALRSAGVAR